MDHSQLMRRGGGTALGLGWLLAITIGGGVLLFAAVGYLLVWRLRMRATPCTTRVYNDDTPEMAEDSEMNANVGRLNSSSTNVLSKRWLKSESSMSRLSSRVSLNNTAQWQPPAVPPLPAQVVRAGHSPSRDLVDDGIQDDGPRIQRRPWSSSWFGRNSWSAMMDGSSAAPNQERDVELGEMPPNEAVDVTQQDQPAEEAEKKQKDGLFKPALKQAFSKEFLKEGLLTRVKTEGFLAKGNTLKKRNSSRDLVKSQTAPQLSTVTQKDGANDDDDEELSRGRSRVPVSNDNKEKADDKEQQPDQQQSNEPIDEQIPEEEFQQEQPDEEEDKRRQLHHQQRIKASLAQTDLHDILKSTEQRLRDGSSRSPVKTPHTSPERERSSPSKTPLSFKSVSSYHTAGAGRMTPSPSKNNLHAGLQNTTPSSKFHIRSESATSIGSAANSLILAATEELDDDQASPSRARRNMWDAPEDVILIDEEEEKERDLHRQQAQMQLQQQTTQKSPHHGRRSMESDASSFLSTLYSVSDRDEEEMSNINTHKIDSAVDSRRPMNAPSPINADIDPFTEARSQHQHNWLANKPSWERRQQLTGPRPLRMARPPAPGGLVESPSLDQTAIPAPLRTISTNSRVRGEGRSDDKRSSVNTTVVLRPPQKTPSEDVKPKSSTAEGYRRATVPDAQSLMSLTSESAYTDMTVNDMAGSSSQETLKMEGEGNDTIIRVDSGTSAMSDAQTRRDSKDSSSSMDEREVLSILMYGSSPKRDLPKPPSRVVLNDGHVLAATALSPRSKNRQDSQSPVPRSRRASVGSTSSSNYDRSSVDGPTEDESASADRVGGLPTRRATTSGLSVSLRDSTNSVGNTIAELRRMNSVVSSYSAASMSTVFGEGVTESPTLPSLRGGGFSPDHVGTKVPASGTLNYLSLGGTAPPPSNRSSRVSSPEQQQQQQQQNQNQADGGSGRKRRSKARPHNVPAGADGQQGKENQPPAHQRSRTVRFQMPSRRREDRKASSARVAPSVLAREPTPEETRRPGTSGKRASVESLGLYDQDGFLKNSPDRDAVARAGRLRV